MACGAAQRRGRARRRRRGSGARARRARPRRARRARPRARHGGAPGEHAGVPATDLRERAAGGGPPRPRRGAGQDVAELRLHREPPLLARRRSQTSGARNAPAAAIAQPGGASRPGRSAGSGSARARDERRARLDRRRHRAALDPGRRQRAARSRGGRRPRPRPACAGSQPERPGGAPGARPPHAARSVAPGAASTRRPRRAPRSVMAAQGVGRGRGEAPARSARWPRRADAHVTRAAASWPAGTRARCGGSETRAMAWSSAAAR